MCRKSLQYFFIFILIFSFRALSADFAPEFESRYIQPIVAEVPGAALVVVVRGKVELQQTYGVVAAGKTSALTDQSLFRIASISKGFASAAAAILVRDTEITWQTPLRAELSNLRFKSRDYGDQINLKHIMSQTTGLMPHAYTNLIEEKLSFRGIVERLHKVDFVCPPGHCYGYQNVVFSLVGDLIQSQTSIDYAEFVDRSLFQPLSMDRASIGHDAYVGDKDHARPHVWNGTKWRTVSSKSDFYKVSPAAGVNASISDMRNWLLAQLGQKPEVLSPDLLSEMHQRVIRTSRRQAHYPYRKGLGKVYYGLGWRIFEYGKQEGFVHHGGYIRGMTSTMVFHPTTKTGVVFLTNAEPKGVNKLVLDFAELHRAIVISGDDPISLANRL